MSATELLTNLLSSTCTQKNLNLFSKYHYSYINQIFGDLTVRELIEEHYKIKKYSLHHEIFDSAFHHFVKTTKKPIQTICSADDGYQNININKNDTLCQSYSLLTYFDRNFFNNPNFIKPNTPQQIQQNQIQIQMDMIQLYRDILQDKKFIKLLNDNIDYENTNLEEKWKDIYGDVMPSMTFNRDLINKILNTLNVWEKYGYWFFIKDGKCPRNNKNTKKRTRTPSPSSSSSSKTPSPSSSSKTRVKRQSTRLMSNKKTSGSSGKMSV